MLCPQCQTSNPDQAKFCLNCGEKLALVCSQCGADLPPQAKFCFECGSKIDVAPPPAPPAPAPDLMVERLQRLVPKEYAERLLATRGKVEGERRMVTILFSDVKGSTAMAEHLDPEDVMEIMDGAFNVLIEPIYRHEGTLARLMGDAILAFFGAPISHEDDPERAIRAALEIVAGAKQYAARLEEERGISGFNVRVGVNTGLVVVGEIGSDLRVEYTAMGDAINLASRMEQAAPVGGVLISHDTYRHVRGLFDVMPREPITVKGKAEPVQAYEVRNAKPRTFRTHTRGIEGIETRMVGREAELKRLQDALYIAFEDSECQMATIVADAGVGKSRLLYELQLWAELLPESFHTFTGRANQELQSTPYALLRDMFAFRFQIQENDPPQTARQKMERGILDCGFPISNLLPKSDVQDLESQVEMRAHIIGQLLGFNFKDSPHLQSVLDDPQQLRDRAEIYLGDYIKAMSDHMPVMILLEDIHWADDSSLDVINGLARTMPDRRLLIICLARPTLFERRPHWGEGYTFHTRLDLLPLSRRDSRFLVKEILQKVEDVPTALRDLLVSGAEGNPFYLEELIKMLIENQIILKEEEHWRVDLSRLADAKVPPTLTGVLQARLDSLPVEERTILQQASVMGRVFWDSAVARISAESQSETRVEDVREFLSALRSREMVFRRETSAFTETQEYTFKHAALRQVTYDSVLKRVRRAYHALIADWLIEQSGGRDDGFIGLIAEHLELAGRATEAVAYLKRAGELAAAQFANAEAVDYFGRALALTPDEDVIAHYDLLLAREKVYNLLGEREPQLGDLVALETLADKLDDDRRRAVVALRKAAYNEAISDFASALAAAQEAVKCADQAQDPQRRIDGLIAWGRALWRQGDFEEARQRLAQALALARQHENRLDEAASLHYLGTVLIFLGDFQGALDHIGQAREIRRALGDRRGEIASLNNLAGIYHDALGDFAQAKAFSEQSLSVRQAIGDRWGEASSLSNLGIIHHALGELEIARDHFQRAIILYTLVNDRRGEALAVENLGLLLHDMGDDQAARYHCEQSLEIERSTGDRSGEGHSLTYLGLALEGLGELEAAEGAYAEALQLRREIGQPAQAIDDMAGLARVALMGGKLEQALTHTEESLAWITENGVNGIEYPLRVYMSCADVLATAGQPGRAAEILKTAQALLGERAARISDPAARQTFLEQVPLHRQLHERLERSGMEILPNSLQASS